MTIGDKEVKQIIVTDSENPEKTVFNVDEILAVITDSHIIEKDGVSVIVDWESP